MRIAVFAGILIAATIFSGSAPAGAANPNGKYLFKAAGCASCHQNGTDPRRLGGGHRIEVGSDIFVVPNISPDRQTGIGKWSRDEFIKAVRTGVSPQGKNYYPAFPYTSYGGMTNKDVGDIWDHIKTLPAVRRKNDPHILSKTTKGLWYIGAGIWNNFFASVPDEFTGDQSKLYQRGKYLVEHVAHCGECHTPRTVTKALDRSQSFAGSVIGRNVKVPPLKPENLRNLGYETFAKSLTGGKPLIGLSDFAEEMKKVSNNMQGLKERDIKAIYSYLSNQELPDTDARQVSTFGALGNSKLAQTARGFLEKHCARCHETGKIKPDLGSNPSFTLRNILNLGTLANNRKYIVKGQPEKSPLYTLLLSKGMPADCIGQSRGKYCLQGSEPKQVEIEKFANWITSLESKEAPRKFVSFEQLHSEAYNDLISQPRSQRRGTRYFSLAPLHNDYKNISSASLKAYVQSTFKLLNALSWNERPVEVETVNNNGYLIRFHLKDVSWNAAKWEKLERAYPYGLRSHTDESLNGLNRILGTTVPIIRADWFAGNASQPPLYHDLLDLPDTLSKLERKLGLNIARNFANDEVIRAGFGAKVSQVSDNNRMIERHGIDTGAFWVSYDFDSSSGRQDIFKFPLGPGGKNGFKHKGGETIFSLPNGFHAYYLNNAKGERVNTGPPNIVHDKEYIGGKEPGVVVNGISCMSCHKLGMRINPRGDEVLQSVKGNFTDFNEEVRDRVAILHKPIGKILRQDSIDFQNALKRARIDPTLTVPKAKELKPTGTGSTLAPPNRELVRALFKVHVDDQIRTEQASAELGLTVAQFNDRVDAASQNFLSTTRRLQQASISRDQWDEIFPLLLARMTDYKSVRYRRIQQLTPTPKNVLTITSEKSVYKKGETFKLFVKSSQKCRLTILNIDNKGRSCVLYPNRALKDQPIKAGETFQFPPKGKGKLLVGEAGRETYIALCSPQAAQIRKLTRDTRRVDCTKMRSGKEYSHALNEISTFIPAQSLSSSATIEITE